MGFHYFSLIVLFLGNEKTKICGAGSIRCYRNAREKLFGTDIIDGLKDEEAKSFRLKCNCLPACTSIKYDADIDRATFDRETLLKFANVSNNPIKKFHQSRVMIYFQSPLVVTLKREVQYSYTDFMAICGGLLGLFLGISALSIIELLYYSTLRLYWNLRRLKSRTVIAPLPKVKTFH